MFRWLIIAASVGLILLSRMASVDQGVPHLPELPDVVRMTINGPATEGSGGGNEGNRPAKAERQTPPAVAVEKLDKASSTNEARQQSEQDEREKADLAAQQSMAETALQTLFLTKLQVWIGAVGTLMVFFALVYSARATHHAGQANRLSLRSFLGRSETVAVRAHRSGRRFEMASEGPANQASLLPRNTGRTPAIDVKIHVEVCAYSKLPEVGKEQFGVDNRARGN